MEDKPTGRIKLTKDNSKKPKAYNKRINKKKKNSEELKLSEQKLKDSNEELKLSEQKLKDSNEELKVTVDKLTAAAGKLKAVNGKFNSLIKRIFKSIFNAINYPIQLFINKLISLGLDKKLAYVILIILALVLWIVFGVITNSTRGVVYSKEIPKQILVKNIVAVPYNQKILLVGNTTSDNTVNVVAEASARVKEIYIENGSQVKKGQVLIRLDETGQAAGLSTATTSLKQARINLKAEQSLKAKGYSSVAMINRKEIEVQSALQKYKQAQDGYSKLLISSPVDGIVNNKTAKVGEFVSVGNSLLTIVNKENAKVNVSVALKWLPVIEKDGKAIVTLPSGNVVTGTVTNIGHSIDVNTGTVNVDISLPNTESSWVSGASVEVQILSKTMPAYYISPSAMTLNKNGEPGLFSIQDNIAHFVKIRILNEDDNGIYVTTDQPELNIVTMGNDKVHDDMDITKLLK